MLELSLPMSHRWQKLFTAVPSNHGAANAAAAVPRFAKFCEKLAIKIFLNRVLVETAENGLQIQVRDGEITKSANFELRTTKTAPISGYSRFSKIGGIWQITGIIQAQNASRGYLLTFACERGLSISGVIYWDR